MNWGLFATLAGFLLPLSIAIRVATLMAVGREPIGHPVQACRLIQLLLLGIPITGKASSVAYAVTGQYGDVGQLTIDFMVTPWGWVHLAMTLAAVVACDVFAPRITDQLLRPPRSEVKATAAYLGRDAGILLLLLILAWLGAR